MWCSWLPTLLALASTIAVAVSQNCGRAGGMTKIVGGQSVGSLQYPWYVALVQTEASSLQVSCGGSLITSRHVLSAAHCFPRISGVRSEQMYRAVLGLVNRCSEKDADMVNLLRVQIHPNYNSKTLQADVSVLTLDRTVSYSPVCLPPKNYQPSGAALIIGFGSTLAKSQYPCTLQQARVNILSQGQCTHTSLSPEYSHIPGTICAGVTSGGVDSCDGDSGGPIMTVGQGGAYTIQGIVSFGEGCARKNLPGVYTKVSYYRDFIDSAIGSFSSTEDLFSGDGEDTSTLFPLDITEPSHPENMSSTTTLLPPSPSFLDMLLALLRPWIEVDSAAGSSSGGGNNVAPSVSGGAGTSRPLSLFEYFLLQFFNRSHRRRDHPKKARALG